MLLLICWFWHIEVDRSCVDIGLLNYSSVVSFEISATETHSRNLSNKHLFLERSTACNAAGSLVIGGFLAGLLTYGSTERLGWQALIDCVLLASTEPGSSISHQMRGIVWRPPCRAHIGPDTGGTSWETGFTSSNGHALHVRCKCDAWFTVSELHCVFLFAGKGTFYSSIPPSPEVLKRAPSWLKCWTATETLPLVSATVFSGFHQPCQYDHQPQSWCLPYGYSHTVKHPSEWCISPVGLRQTAAYHQSNIDHTCHISITVEGTRNHDRVNSSSWRPAFVSDYSYLTKKWEIILSYAKLHLNWKREVSNITRPEYLRDLG